MVILDLPFAHAGEGGPWYVIEQGSVTEFKTRFLALSFANARALQLARSGLKVLVNVEGEDGVWRLFDEHLKASLDAGVNRAGFRRGG